MSKWKLFKKGTDHELKNGAQVVDFRGEEGTLLGGHPPKHPGSTGRVYLQRGDYEEELYPGVIDAEWRRV